MNSKLANLLALLLILILVPALTVRAFQVTGNSQPVVRLGRTLNIGAEVRGFAVSPDGKVVAVALDRAVQLWDVTTGQRLQTFAGFGKRPELHWSPDGSRLLITRWGKETALWSAQSGTSELQTLKLERDLRTVSWSPNGKLLLTTHSGALADVWDARKLTRLFQLKLKKSLIDAKWNPDARTIITLTRDTGWKDELKLKPPSLIQVWETETGKEKFAIRLKRLGQTEKVEFNADGKFILTVGGWDVPELWDAATGSLHAKLNPPWCNRKNCFTEHAEFSPDGSLVLTRSRFSDSQDLWDVVSGKFIASVEGAEWDTFVSQGFSPDGRLLAVYREHPRNWKSFARESSIQLYDTRTGKLGVALTGKNMMDSTHQIVWSSDSQTLATAGGSHFYQGKLWNVPSGKLRAELELFTKRNKLPVGGFFEDFDQLSFHPKKSVLIGTSQKLVKFWDAAGGTLLQSIAVSFAKWTEDGGKLVTIGDEGKSLLVWELVN